VAEEVIGSFRTVRSFSQEEKEVRRFVHELEQVLSVAKKRAFFQGSGVGLVQMMVWGACAVSFYFGGYLVGKSELFFGDL
jgi:ABC-type multidrug transport system fused ATPase/permease subunit